MSSLPKPDSALIFERFTPSIFLSVESQERESTGELYGSVASCGQYKTPAWKAPQTNSYIKAIILLGIYYAVAVLIKNKNKTNKKTNTKTKNQTQKNLSTSVLEVLANSQQNKTQASASSHSKEKRK